MTLLSFPAFPRTVQAVIFDMDGLLIDTERHVRVATLGAADEIGQPIDDDFYAGIIGTPWPETYAMLRAFFGGDEGFGRFRTAFQTRIALLRTAIALMPGVVEIIDHLEVLGLPLAVATSTGRDKAEEHLHQAGIRHRFAALVTRDDVERGKPHPEPYLTAAARLDADPSLCVALEDSHNGIRSAHAAGLMPVMVPDLLPATAEMHRLALHVADDLHGVRALFA
ncbi:HAD family hydrolase [Niveispirillum fermenti]|uniref:HAD family hydrolase n=1 Tax=Niveispirillum fermenti TaxID=1233113 RepID=UPI003A84E932